MLSLAQGAGPGSGVGTAQAAGTPAAAGDGCTLPVLKPVVRTGVGPGDARTGAGAGTGVGTGGGAGTGAFLGRGALTNSNTSSSSRGVQAMRPLHHTRVSRRMAPSLNACRKSSTVWGADWEPFSSTKR